MVETKPPCTKKCFNDPLAAARFMAGLYLAGKNSKGGRPGVYWCDSHQAFHWGHTVSPYHTTNNIERKSK